MSATFESTDAAEMAFEVNDTVANVSGASGRFTAGEFANGVARVTVGENPTNEDAFSFDYKGSDLGIAQVAAVVTVDNDTVWTSNGDPGGWTTEQIDVSDYKGPNNISFEMRVSTETLNAEAIFFDNVVWTNLPKPNKCKIDQDSYDGNGIKSDFQVVGGELSTCALQAKDKAGSKSLNSSYPNGLDTPQWFEPPESHDYPKRGGRISYDVRVNQSGTTSYFYFGDEDTSSEYYGVAWDPSNEELTVGGSGISSKTVNGNSNGAGDYYSIIIDYDLDASTDTGVIYARAVNKSGDTVAHVGINDKQWDGGETGQLGFAADGDGTVTWDNLEYGGTDFEKVLPQPGESYYTNGTEQSAGGPKGVAHDGGWIHDRLPVEPGETRTYNYYVDVGTELLVSLRDGPSTETDSISDIENEIHRFTDRANFRAFRDGQKVIVSLTIDYIDNNSVMMTAKATREDGLTSELTQTWSSASSYDEIFVSTYEYDQPLDQSYSLRLIPERTGPSSANGYLYESDVNTWTPISGYGHSGGWVDLNGGIEPGTIERIPFFRPSGAPDSYLDIQLRDKPASDPSRGPNSGLSDQFKTSVNNLLGVPSGEQTILVFDYSVPGEVLLRATRLDTGEVVEVEVVSLPAEDIPLYLSTYEDGNPSDSESIRYAPFG